jgi:hypothetical protein
MLTVKSAVFSGFPAVVCPELAATTRRDNDAGTEGALDAAGEARDQTP